MGKLRFRLRISRVIPSFNCRSKHSTTTTASNPNTATSNNLSPFHHCLRRRCRHAPLVSNDSGANCCPRRLHHRRLLRPPSSSSGGEADAEADDLPLMRGNNYLWSKSEKWHVISCASSENSPSSSPPRSKIDFDLFASRKSRCTRESDSSGDDSGWFSTDEEYGGYEYNYKRRFSTEKSSIETSCFAVSKVSADPRGDFRRSMAEMVVERDIYDVEGLRWLLHCFLSLNDSCHRQAILAAFTDVWYAIFPSVALAVTFPKMFYK